MTLADLIKRAEWLVANRPPAEAVDLLRSWTPSAASALKDMGQALKETLELIAAVNALSDGISERLETKPSPQKYGVPFGLVNDLNAVAKKVEASKPAQARAALAAQPEPAAQDKEDAERLSVSTLTRAIQSIKGSTYNLTKDECIFVLENLRDDAARAATKPQEGA